MSPFEALDFSGRRRLPMIHAAESAECGLACMAMIAGYFGHRTDLNSLRQRFSVSNSGLGLRGLIDLADQISLSSRPMKVRLEDLSKLGAPAILHWDLNHFVVLKSASEKGVVIHDPSRGVRRLSQSDVSDHYTGIALELSPTQAFARTEPPTRIRISDFWSKADGLWLSAAQLLALSVLLQVFAFAAPFQAQLVIDEAISHSDLGLLTILAWGFGLVVVLQALVAALRSWVTTTLGALFAFQVTGNVVRRLLRLPASYFEKRHVGDILSRLGSTSAIQDAVTTGVISSMIDGAMALIAGAILFIYSPVLAMFVIGSLCLSLLAALSFYPASRRQTLEGLQASAVERSHLLETLRAASTIKVMGAGAIRESRWRNLYAAATNASVLASKYGLLNSLTQSIITGLQSVLVIFFGAKLVIAGQGFSIGMLVAFLSFRQTFSDRVISLINQAFQFRMLHMHLDRLGDIVGAAPEAASDDLAPMEVHGAIEVENLSYRYGDADPWILRGIDLSIARGDFLAITGASGGGKSTLMKLLTGLVAPTKGEIRLDDVPASPERWQAYRRQIGVVSQSDQLLSGSLAENISFFDPALDMQVVRDAARAAQIDEEIMRMPMQYVTLVGDMGSSLSGGQRQRVLLARALYRHPKVLFLDEGTANLDLATEAAIVETIANLPITRIVVAHRPALIERASHVLLLKNGEVELVKNDRALVQAVA